MAKKLKCTKNLYMEDNEHSFTKDMTYEVIGECEKVTEYTKVVDNVNSPHTLGMWHKHFKIVK